jgi:hypothetical protein
MNELQANLKSDMAYVVVGADGKTVGGLMRNSSKGSHIFVIDHRDLQLSEQSSKVTLIKTDWGLREVSGIISCQMLNKKLNQLCMIKNDAVIAENPEAYKDVDLFVARASELFHISCSTLISFGKQFTENLYKNIAHIARKPGINGLQNRFPLPAVIVSAGPSLDKNVHLLNGLKDKALIIACGSTMSALNHHGVVPHILIATDAAHDKDLDVPAETLLLCPYEGPAPVIARHDYKAFFKTFDCHIKGLPETGILKQNLSVSTAGVSLALFMGCTDIIWVGQDLAFNGDQHHATGNLETDGTECSAVTINYPPCEIPGYYGGTVQSHTQWRDINEYLQSVMRFYPGNYFNCTEGGAAITGAAHMPLQDVALLLKPVENIEKRIKNSLENSKIDANSAFRILSTARTNVMSLSHKAARFAGKTYTLAEYRMFFTDLRGQRGWSEIKMRLEPMMDWLIFQQRDGESDSRQYEGYREMAKMLADFTRELSAMFDAILKEVRRDG